MGRRTQPTLSDLGMSALIGLGPEHAPPHHRKRRDGALAGFGATRLRNSIFGNIDSVFEHRHLLGMGHFPR